MWTGVYARVKPYVDCRRPALMNVFVVLMVVVVLKEPEVKSITMRISHVDYLFVTVIKPRGKP